MTIDGIEYAKERIKALPALKPKSISMYGEYLEDLNLGTKDLLKVLQFFSEHYEYKRFK